MPNLKKPLAAYETQTLKFVNTFVNWYYSDYNSEPYSESLDETLDRFVSRCPFDSFELADMYLDLCTVQQVIKYDATAQELTSWYFGRLELETGSRLGVNLENWLLLKRQKPSSVLDEVAKSYKTAIDTFAKIANEIGQKFK